MCTYIYIHTYTHTHTHIQDSKTGSCNQVVGTPSLNLGDIGFVTANRLTILKFYMLVKRLTSLSFASWPRD